MMTSSVLTVFPARYSNLSRIQRSISLHINNSQVQPILDGDVDMTVLEHHFYLQAATKEFYTVKRASRLATYPLCSIVIISNRSWGPHFATFAFRRAIFTEGGVRYPDNSIAEDYAFAEHALERGYKIKVLENQDGTVIPRRFTE